MVGSTVESTVQWYGCTVVRLGGLGTIWWYGAVVRWYGKAEGGVGTWGNGDVSAGVWWCGCGLVRRVCDVVRIRAGLAGMKVKRGRGTVGT